jgi:long-chain fatty acid transport protein
MPEKAPFCIKARQLGVDMSFRHLKSVLMACGGAAVLIATSSLANAGGLAVREQSAYGQGTSYAGVAAGGSLSTMFWNPATMTQVYGIQSEAVLSGLIPNSSHTATSGTGLALGGTGNVAHSALVPSSYFSYQFNDKLWLGLSVNAPFGLTETFPDNWAGRSFGAGGESLATYNATPTIAYKFNDLISVGFGVQLQYANFNFSQGTLTGLTLGNQAYVNAAGWGFGFTGGITLTPTPTTTIGLGYRSGINQKFNGTFNAGALCAATTCGSVNGTINVPDVVSLGLRQKLSSQWTVMGTAEWTNWSRATSVGIMQPSGAPVVLGITNLVIPLNYRDGWFFSVGTEYQWSERLALRTGIAFERSPVTDVVRNPVIPDNDRLWLSLGASYKFNAKTTLDFAYSHVFVKDAPISITNTSNPGFIPGVTGTYTGSVSSSLDIISVALKYRWDDPAPAPTKVGYFKAK